MRFEGEQLSASLPTPRLLAAGPTGDPRAEVLRSVPPPPPLDIRAAFWYGVVGEGDVPAMIAATRSFSGRAFSAREMTLIREVVRDCPGLSRMELARTVCELLRPNGRLKARECREFLERLDADGAAGAAGQAPGPRAGFGHPRAPDGGRRAGSPARG